MIEGYDIICFANDWDAEPLSKKHIMNRLAARNRILWVNSIGNRNPTVSTHDFGRIVKKLWAFSKGCRQVTDHIHVFTPLAIPFHGNALARWFNRRWLAFQIRRVCRSIHFVDPVVYTFVPSSADVVGNLGEKRVIYHCTDEFSEFSGTDKSAIAAMERTLMRKSDVIIACSEPLQETKRKSGVRTCLVTHGVEVDHFRQACDPHTNVPADIASIPHPIVGFFGLIESWVDLRLIAFLARAKPAWSFVLIGRMAADDAPVRGIPNIHVLGRREYAQLPGYCKAFDVALLPFTINELTLASNPLKLREYLAAGLPVVASAIPEAERLRGLLKIAKTDGEFLWQLEDLLATPLTEGRRMKISETMSGESWDGKVEEISRIVESLGSEQRQASVLAEAEVAG
jgi:glycosyltransferase involved in cell wall biosynthesis